MANTNSWVLQTKSFSLSLCFRPAEAVPYSKDESLYHQVKCGNIAEIRKLHHDGAGLEWVDKEGRTPLILACKRSAFFPVAKLLIELGANVNAYCPGHHGGTPLHHAAKHGLRETVNLLLSHGANPLLMNDDGQTALGLAGEKGHVVVVRSIEKRICLFSGWLRDFIFCKRPRNFWAVVLPCTSRNQTQPPRLYLALYCEVQFARPLDIIQLWNSRIKQPDFSQRCPTVVIKDISGKTKSRLASANEGDRDQLLMFYNACRGFPQTGNRIPATPVAAVTPKPVNPRVTTSRTPPTVATVTPKRVNPQVTTSRTPPTVATVTPKRVNPQVTTSRTPPTVAAVTPKLVNPRVTTSRTPPTVAAVTPKPVNPRVTTSRTPPTVAVVTPKPVNPRVTTSRTPPTVAAVTPKPVNPRVTTSRTPPTVAAITPTAVNPQVTTSRTPPTVAVVTPTPVNPQVTTSRTPPTTTTPSPEDVELAMAMNASIQSAISSGALPLSNIQSNPSPEDVEFAMAMNASIQSAISEGALPLSVDIQSNALPPASSLPSAPPINTDIFYNISPIHYPSVDSSPISFTVNTKPGISSSSSNTSNSCVVCLDAAVEGACIPCGHMAGCMPCLNEINARQWGCPVCRTPIEQVIKLYTV